MQVIRTVLADAHHIYIEGLKTVLYGKTTHGLFDITGIANSSASLLSMLGERTIAADILILDFNLPDIDGPELIHQIRSDRPELKILVLTSYNDPKVVKSAYKLGANGYILKNKEVEELFTAIQTVLEGQIFMGEGIAINDNAAGSRSQDRRPASNAAYFEDRFIKKYLLTRRELEVLRLIVQALNNKEIAEALFISTQTVGVHRKNIMRKLGVSNTASLIKTAYDNSIL